jgi:hypothetical protein
MGDHDNSREKGVEEKANRNSSRGDRDGRRMVLTTRHGIKLSFRGGQIIEAVANVASRIWESTPWILKPFCALGGFCSLVEAIRFEGTSLSVEEYERLENIQNICNGLSDLSEN